MLQDEARRPRGGHILRRLALAVGLLASPAAADVCEDAALRAADAHGVPLAVMRAVLRVETGEGRGEARRGWPWSANADGRSFRFDTLGEAMAFATGSAARAAGNVDFGCFQISERWHGDAFSGPREMLDPMRNALYAARLLRGHHERLGDWTLAAGAYHSMTEALAVRYRARFRDELAALPDASAAPAAPVRVAARTGPAKPLLAGRRAAPIFTRVALGGPGERRRDDGADFDAPRARAPAAPSGGTRAVAPLPSHPPLERVRPLVARTARPLVEGGAAAPGSLVPMSSAGGSLLGAGWGG